MRERIEGDLVLNGEIQHKIFELLDLVDIINRNLQRLSAPNFNPNNQFIKKWNENFEIVASGFDVKIDEDDEVDFDTMEKTISEKFELAKATLDEMYEVHPILKTVEEKKNDIAKYKIVDENKNDIDKDNEMEFKLWCSLLLDARTDEYFSCRNKSNMSRLKKEIEEFDFSSLECIINLLKMNKPYVIARKRLIIGQLRNMGFNEQDIMSRLEEIEMTPVDYINAARGVAGEFLDRLKWKFNK